MPKDQDSLEYDTSYSRPARSDRMNLHASLRSTLYLIEDELSDDPNKYPSRLTQLTEDIFIYKHPDPHIEVTYKIDFDKKIIRIMHIAALTLDVRKLLFVSYSHQDKEWLVELKKWLKPLEQRDLVTIWDDEEIKAGDDWQDKIEKALSNAKAALLLISQDFLTSDFITKNELPPLLDKAKEEGLNILWIAVRPSTVEDSKIIQYQAVHKDPPLSQLEPNARENEFKHIFDKIKEAVGQ